MRTNAVHENASTVTSRRPATRSGNLRSIERHRLSIRDIQSPFGMQVTAAYTDRLLTDTEYTWYTGDVWSMRFTICAVVFCSLATAVNASAQAAQLASN